MVLQRSCHHHPGFRRVLQVEQNAGGMRHRPLSGEAMAAIEAAVGRSWDCPGGVPSASVLTRDDVKLVGPLF
jgi:hypothetical protein